MVLDKFGFDGMNDKNGKDLPIWMVCADSSNDRRYSGLVSVTILIRRIQQYEKVYKRIGKSRESGAYSV